MDAILPVMRPLFTIAFGLSLLLVDNARAQSPQPDPALLDRARGGDAAAQVALAIQYRDGKGVPRDYAEAMRWAHLAADRGDPAAMDFVGFMYFRGVGVKRNAEIAIGYFKAAADKSPSAAWNLGQSYFAAQGVEQDIPRALEMWRKAAAMGHGRAASTAAMMYLSGEGVDVDIDQARKLAEAYRIDGVPALGVHGRYFTSGTLAGTTDRSLMVTDYLIQLVRKAA